MKCPNCGAPMSGTTCAYCGSTRTPETARGPEGGQERNGGRGQRNVFDWILILLGGLWCLIIFSVAMDIGFRKSSEWVAGITAALPGIILLLIGFRRKKGKADRSESDRR